MGPIVTASKQGRPLQGPAADRAWKSIVARDAGADGRFVYGVRTTGVYCRPSCASRRPRRENVAVFATPDAAEAAGFRACRRCRPQLGADSAADTPAARAVARARAYLAAHADRAVGLEELGAEVGMSPAHLQRTFKRLVGVSPKAYHDARRLDRLKHRLRRGDTVTRATYEAGFNSGGAAYARAEAGMGMTPAQYRRGGRGVGIRYATAASRLGRVLVAATARGVCAVSLGDDDAALEAALREEFPAAAIERVPADDHAIAGWLGAVVRHLDAGETRLDLPLDASGTPFQQRVWGALREIPYGETRTYAQIAATIGTPRATRAVAGACAKNRLALVIPCHRVVRGTGETGGYRWGSARKRQLLAQEHAIVARAV